MGNITCVSCGCQNKEKAIFCENCGRFLLASKLNSFYTEGSERPEELKINRITENIAKVPHIDVLWDETVDAYARKAERIQALLRVKDMGIQSNELNEKMERFLNLCRKSDFEIAFVGAVKAGKSTLINALLGKNYAPTDTTPETAVLTKFRSSRRDFVRVKFYSEKEWNKLWKSVQNGAEEYLKLYRSIKAEQEKTKWVGRPEYFIELENDQIEGQLKQWSSSQSSKHFFVKEIEVGISTMPRDIPKEVVFVDTPGLFDPVAFRSKIAIDYIQSANAVLVCIKATDLHGEEVKTVESVFSFSGHKRDKVFLIATNWDKLNDLVVDWRKRHAYMVDSFTGKAFYPDHDMARKNIMYADARHYNLCRNFEQLDRRDKSNIVRLLLQIQDDAEAAKEHGIILPKGFEDLLMFDAGIPSVTVCSKLMEITNIQTIKQRVLDELVRQFSSIRLSDINILYKDIMHMVSRIAGERKETIGERIALTDSDLQEVEDKLNETKRNMEEIRQCQAQLTAALNSMNKITQQRLANVLQYLEQ